VKTLEEIEEILDKIQGLVNDGHQDATVIWDCLRWVIDEETISPYTSYIAEN
jgi:hypothetical protein